MPELLPALPDSEFRRVLCVVAHPDDVEYGTSSAVAVWTARGVDVAYLVLTRGEAGMDASRRTAPGRSGPASRSRGRAAVGVTDVTFLEHPDGVLEYGLPLRRDIARRIREYRPDVVLTGSWELEFVAGLNMADHRVAGLADARRGARRRQPVGVHRAARRAAWSLAGPLAAGQRGPRATHGVEVTGDALQAGIASLEAHEEYLAGLPGHPAPKDMLPMIAAMQGRAMGVEHAGPVPGLRPAGAAAAARLTSRGRAPGSLPPSGPGPAAWPRGDA